jgi:hypothetical protein
MPALIFKIVWPTYDFETPELRQEKQQHTLPQDMLLQPSRGQVGDTVKPVHKAV